MVQRAFGADAFANYELLAEALPHLVWFARPDGTVTYYNRRAELYSGLEVDPAGEYEWAPLVHPDDLERTVAAWTRAVEQHEPYECDHRVQMADGSFRWHVSRALRLDTSHGTMWFGTATDTHALLEAADALAESEGLLRSVIGALDEGYCLCELVFDAAGRPVDYRFLETNQLFEVATGLHDATGRTAYDLVPGLEPHWLETYSQVALGDRPLRFEQESPALGRRFDVFATPVAPRGRFALLFSDITERHAAQEALQESERRFRNMADNAPVMIRVTDADGQCSYLNSRWFEFTGQPEECALGQGWIDAAHPDDRATLTSSFAEATRHHSGFRLEYRLRRSDGVDRWVVDAAAPRLGHDGAFLGYVGSVLDITERKEAEEALAARRDHEHEIAVQLQQSLLPTALVEDPRVELAARYVPSMETLQVGGDWYESFVTADGRIGVVVGDIVGHNTEAAAIMGQVRAGLLALAAHATDPGALLCEIDEFILRYRLTDFATAVCLFVDPDDGHVEYSSAGHPPVLVVAPDGSHHWLEGGRDLPLGLRAVERRPCAAIRLAPGSILVAYSDGLIERRDETLDRGLERLRRATVDHREEPTHALCGNLLAELGEGGGFDDDTVVLAVRVGG